MSATLARLIVVCSMLSTALAQSSSPPPASSQSQPTNAQANGPSKGFVLEDGTAVTLRLGRSLSSADAHAGDRVDFEVAEEVSVNRIVVVPKDSRASGTVITAHKKKTDGSCRQTRCQHRQRPAGEWRKGNTTRCEGEPRRESHGDNGRGHGRHQLDRLAGGPSLSPHAWEGCHHPQRDRGDGVRQR